MSIMRKIYLLLILLFLLAQSACSRPDIPWHNSYRGKLGDSSGGLALVFDGADIAGELYFDGDHTDIPLSGRLDERQIELYGIDGTVLKAEFVRNDSQFGNEELDKEVLKGFVIRDAIKLNMYFSIRHGSAGDLSRKYLIAGFDNDDELESFACEFKDAVLAGNKNKVAKMLWYPITVELKNKSVKQFQDKEDFLGFYDDVFYLEFINAFERAVPHDMFARYDGVMMTSDDSNLWIWFTRSEGKTGVRSIIYDQD